MIMYYDSRPGRAPHDVPVPYSAGLRGPPPPLVRAQRDRHVQHHRSGKGTDGKGKLTTQSSVELTHNSSLNDHLLFIASLK